MRAIKRVVVGRRILRYLSAFGVPGIRGVPLLTGCGGGGRVVIANHCHCKV